MSDPEDSKPDAGSGDQATPAGPEPGSPETEGAAAESAAPESPKPDSPKPDSPEPDSPEPDSSAPASPEPGKPAPQDGEPPAESAAPPEPAEDEAAKKAAAEAAAKARAEAAAKAKAAKEAAEAAKPPWERDPVVPEWQDAGDDPLAAALAAAHGEGLAAARAFAGDLVLDVAPAALRAVASDLKQNHGYSLLVDICGAHYPEREGGAFDVVYHLYCFAQNRRVRLKVRTDGEGDVPSLVSVWEGANWPEREAWDMFGIRFADHPDMTRILMWEGFNGFPLRKEFPVEGVDTGAAIYPEYYEREAGPVAGTGTGWKPAPPPEPPSPEAPSPEIAAPAAEPGEEGSAEPAA